MELQGHEFENTIFHLFMFHVVLDVFEQVMLTCEFSVSFKVVDCLNEVVT